MLSVISFTRTMRRVTTHPDTIPTRSMVNNAIGRACASGRSVMPLCVEVRRAHTETSRTVKSRSTMAATPAMQADKQEQTSEEGKNDERQTSIPHS